MINQSAHTLHASMYNIQLHWTSLIHFVYCMHRLNQRWLTSFTLTAWHTSLFPLTLIWGKYGVRGPPIILSTTTFWTELSPLWELASFQKIPFFQKILLSCSKNFGEICSKCADFFGSKTPDFGPILAQIGPKSGVFGTPQNLQNLLQNRKFRFWAIFALCIWEKSRDTKGEIGPKTPILRYSVNIH